jgi:hypothetical protein
MHNPSQPTKGFRSRSRGADHRTRSAVIAGGSSCGTHFLTLLLPDRLGIHHPPPAWSPFPADIEIRSQAAGRSRPTYPLEFQGSSPTHVAHGWRCRVRPKDDGEEVLDLGFLDHSVDSADRAANLSSDSRDGEAGCSESGDPGMPHSLGANDCSGPRSRATRFAGNLLAKPKAPGASGAFVILLHSSRPTSTAKI